jgi:hypothetical protein
MDFQNSQKRGDARDKSDGHNKHTLHVARGSRGEPERKDFLALFLLGSAVGPAFTAWPVSSLDELVTFLSRVAKEKVSPLRENKVSVSVGRMSDHCRYVAVNMLRIVRYCVSRLVGMLDDDNPLWESGRISGR